MADLSQRRREWLVRILAVLAGLGLAALAPVAHLLGKLPFAGTLALQYVALTAIIWGLNAFLFRRLALSWVSLPLFSLATFGVLFLLGYFGQEIVLPFALSMAQRFIG